MYPISFNSASVLPAVSRASSLSLPLEVPSQGLASDVAWCFPQGMANLAAIFSSDSAYLPVLVLLAAEASHCEFSQANLPEYNTVWPDNRVSQGPSSDTL